ncbi:MAG: hypothetical protein C0623_04460 [Desulfuromonas sp.]|nr:MAG: hypothetical protein C0623_04460 [Desulfuromonas sp.]
MRPAIPWLSSLILHSLFLCGLFLLTERPPEPPLRLSLDFQLVMPEPVPTAQPVAPVQPEEMVPSDIVEPQPVPAVSKPQPPVAKIEAAAPEEIKAPQSDELTGPPIPPAVSQPVAAPEPRQDNRVDQAAVYAQTVKHLRGVVLRKLVYPIIARRQGWQGKLVLSFILCADGSVEELKVDESSGYKVLDRAALKAVNANTPFSGDYARTKVRLPINFQLN